MVKKTLVLAVSAWLTTVPSWAAVSPQEAAHLGADLTPLGAEKAGNADGSIPAWTGGLKSAAEAGFPDYKTGQHHRLFHPGNDATGASRRRDPAGA